MELATKIDRTQLGLRIAKRAYLTFLGHCPRSSKKRRPAPPSKESRRHDVETHSELNSSLLVHAALVFTISTH